MSEKMTDERRGQIQALLNDAAKKLEEARQLTEGFDWSPGSSFYFEALGYGAGASLSEGEWRPSSQSC